MEMFLGSHHFLLMKKHTPPPLFFSGLGCSVHPKNREVVRRRYSVVRDRRSEPCFGQTNDVTVYDVPLETNPGSKIVHLIIQGLDIGEQNTRQGGTVSPFPQPVTNSSTFPAVFPSPPGIIEAALSASVLRRSPMATLDLCIKCPGSG